MKKFAFLLMARAAALILNILGRLCRPCSFADNVYELSVCQVYVHPARFLLPDFVSIQNIPNGPCR